MEKKKKRISTPCLRDRFNNYFMDSGSPWDSILSETLFFEYLLSYDTEEITTLIKEIVMFYFLNHTK